MQSSVLAGLTRRFSIQPSTPWYRTVALRGILFARLQLPKLPHTHTNTPPHPLLQTDSAPLCLQFIIIESDVSEAAFCTDQLSLPAHQA
jgi:hypothetical protein